MHAYARQQVNARITLYIKACRLCQTVGTLFQVVRVVAQHQQCKSAVGFA